MERIAHELSETTGDTRFVVSPIRLEMLFERFDRDSRGTIAYHDFLDFVVGKRTRSSDGLRKQREDSFVESTRAGFRRLVESGRNPALMFRDIDANKDGVVSFEEFRRVMKNIARRVARNGGAPMK